MTAADSAKGLELFLSTEKAAEAAKRFVDAVDSAATAVERLGAVNKTAQTVLDDVGKSTTTAATGLGKTGDALGKMGPPLRLSADGLSVLGRQLGAAGNTAQEFERRLGKGVSAQQAFAGAGRTVAAMLRLLEVTPAARVLTGVSEAMGSASTATRGFSALLGATPWATVISLAGTAAAAFFAFGNEVEETNVRLKRMQDETRDAEASARRLDDLRRSIIAGGDAGAGAAFVKTLQADLVELNDKIAAGVKTLPAETILGAIEQQAPATIAALRRTMDELKEFAKAGQEAPEEVKRQFLLLSQEVEQRFGVSIKTARDRLTENAFSPANVNRGFIADAMQVVRAFSTAVDKLAGSGTADRTVADANRRRDDLAGGILPKEEPKGTSSRLAAGERERTSALADYLTLKERELALLGKTEEQQTRIRIVQETYVAAMKDGQLPTMQQFATLGLILATHERINAVQAEEKRAKSVGEIIANLERENALLEQQGTAREALRIEQETEIALSRIKGGATEDEAARIDALLAKKRELLDLDQQRRTEGRVAAKELAAAEREVEQLMRQFGDSASTALERLIIDGQKARDVMRQLADDLARQALRATAGAAFQQLAGIAGQAIVGMFAGGSPYTSTIGQPGYNPSTYGPQLPNLRGGVIPAMDGQVVDEFGFMKRAGKLYSFAEGGKSTPEAIMPLQRDSRGRLGVAAAGGGGPTNITMSFPAVRTAQDARAMRATVGQQVRRMLDSDRRGRRGLRPRE